MESIPYEIERKFLIKYPESSFISGIEDISDITQTYLSSGAEGFSERVRRRQSADKTLYIHTLKKHINDMRRVEIENEVSEEEYQELLKRADPGRRVIHKKRLCYYYKNQMFEIDLYPFWEDRAVMEIELKDENQQIIFPESISIIKEVTSDKRYTNAAIAREIPQDKI